MENLASWSKARKYKLLQLLLVRFNELIQCLMYIKRDLERERGHNNEEKKKMSGYQLTRIHRFSIKLMKQWQLIKTKVPWLN